ncbi:hypothetical protein C8J57DRAFT_1242299 [Mycena rebaudengoi]|nr:hypothetical protein C8J57DRAFT_1242299 [Mycena rebaudengoi]
MYSTELTRRASSDSSQRTVRADTTSTFVEEDSPPSEKRGDRGKPLKSSIKSFFGLERRDTEEGANTNTLFEKELKRGPPCLAKVGGQSTYSGRVLKEFRAQETKKAYHSQQTMVGEEPSMAKTVIMQVPNSLPPNSLSRLGARVKRCARRVKMYLGKEFEHLLSSRISGVFKLMIFDFPQLVWVGLKWTCIEGLNGPALTSDGHALASLLSSSLFALWPSGSLAFVQVEYWDVVWNLFAGYWYVL